jgi:hypothetical protein
MFPGDAAILTPTPAAADAEPDRESLGGVQLPKATEEGQLGPARPDRGEAAPDEAPATDGEPSEEDAAGAGLGGLPGEGPLPGFELPGIGRPAPAPEGTPPAEGDEPPAGGPEAGPEAGPGAEPGSDPLDPFSTAPPAPPAWISTAALHRAALEQSLEPLPVVEHAAAIAEAIGAETPHPDQTPIGASAPLEVQVPVSFTAPAGSGRNLHSDDAPPVLPPALAQGVNGIGSEAATRGQSDGAPVVKQPESVQPIVVDDRVTAASAEEPLGIHLINPAAAMVDPLAEGLQQAIYFEASDK